MFDFVVYERPARPEVWLEGTDRSQLPQAWLGQTSRRPLPWPSDPLREADDASPHSQVRNRPSPPPSYRKATEDGQPSPSHSFAGSLQPRPRLRLQLNSSEHPKRSPSTFGASDLPLPLDVTEHDSSVEQMPNTPQHRPVGRLRYVNGRWVPSAAL